MGDLEKEPKGGVGPPAESILQSQLPQKADFEANAASSNFNDSIRATAKTYKTANEFSIKVHYVDETMSLKTVLKSL